MQASKNVLFDTYRSQITQALTQELRLTSSDSALEITLELPPDPKMGDFAFPTFRLAKELKKAPPLIAKELAAKINSQIKNIDVQALGPYINFTVDKQALTGDVLASLLLSQNKLGEKQMAIAPTVIMEFSSPNVAKPFNIYHLRSTMIGNCLYRILAARGFDPVAINHLGDWGSQYGTLAVAYEMWGDDQELEKRGIEYLVELYVRINKLMEEDSSLKEKTRQYFARLEKGDPQIQAVWKKFVDLSLKEFQKTYARLHVKFDHFWGESFYIDKVQSLEKKLEDSKLLIESEGAYIVPLEAYNMPPCIVRKTDGSTIYATRDLAAAIYRHERFAFSKMVYVVGGEQKLHFAQVFKVLELLNFKWAKDCVHVDFGLYRFGDQKMSTRKGNFVTMEAVLDHAVERVREIMHEKEETRESATIMSESEKNEIAEIIGTGAIVFNDLVTDRNTPVQFDLEKVLDFEGETGPYIQYAHTRCLGILRNAPKNLVNGLDIEKLLDLSFQQKIFTDLHQAAQEKISFAEEFDLIRTLAKFPIVLDSVLETNRPSLLAHYLIEITKTFNHFYRTHKVLVEDAKLAQARLSLVLATQRTLLKGLTLLGMRVPQRM